MRARSVVVSAIAVLFASVGHADDSAPIPASLDEAAAQHGPVAPGRAEPVLPSDPPSPPPSSESSAPAPAGPAPLTAAAAGEVEKVGEWDIVAVTSSRRRPDGNETTDDCGYERDVIVQRTEPVLRRGPAVLIVPCATNVDGLPVPSTPTLRLSTALALPPRLQTSSGVLSLAHGRLALEAERLDLDAVAAVLTSLAPSLEECHAKAGGPAGDLSVRIALVAGQATAVTSTEGSLKHGVVERCLVDVLRAAPLPPPLTSSAGGGAPVQGRLRATFTFEQVRLGAGGARPICKDGEEPVSEDGQPSCTVRVPPHPCAPGEVKKTREQLAPGEEPCFDVPVERGVPFLKGELTSMGDVVLVNQRTSFGVGLGLNAIDGITFGVLRPDINLQFGKFRLGLGAPLRFELFNLQTLDLLGGDPLGSVTGNFGRFRTEDWDQVEDFVRPLRYISWGQKEDRLYIDVNRVHAITIGHGQLVRRYAPNVDIDEDNIFAQVDGYNEWGGVELMAGPFPIPRLVGGLAFIKPLGIVNSFSPVARDDSWLREVASSWSIGFSYVTDLNSPTGLEARAGNDGQQRFIVDAANQLVWRNKVNPVGDVVQGVGADSEVKLFKSSAVDIKVYGDWSQLFFPGDSSSAAAFAPFTGGGATVGGLVRVSLGETPVRSIEQEDEETKAGRKPREKKAAHGLRLRLEGRTFAPTYLPSYWNTLYEVDRFQFGLAADRRTLPTKIAFLASQQEEPWRAGYYGELSYAWVDVVGATIAFEDAHPLGATTTPVRGRNLALHVESKGLGWLQLFGTYHFRNFEFGELDRLFSFTTDNEILFVGGRLQVLPILFLNLGVQRAFRVGFGNADDDTPDSRGQRLTSVGLQNAWTVGGDVELGWQF
jgi:hypothetical protein